MNRSLSTDPLPVCAGRGEQASYHPDLSKRAIFPSRVAIPMLLLGRALRLRFSLHTVLSRAPPSGHAGSYGMTHILLG